MAATQYGTKLKIGPSQSLGTNYIAISDNIGDTESNQTDQRDGNGAIVTRIVKDTRPLRKIVAVAKDAATPFSDFVKDTKCTFTGHTDYWVRSVDINETEDPTTVTLELEYLPLTVVT